MLEANTRHTEVYISIGLNKMTPGRAIAAAYHLTDHLPRMAQPQICNQILQ